MQFFGRKIISYASLTTSNTLNYSLTYPSFAHLEITSLVDFSIDSFSNTTLCDFAILHGLPLIEGDCGERRRFLRPFEYLGWVDSGLILVVLYGAYVSYVGSAVLFVTPTTP